MRPFNTRLYWRLLLWFYGVSLLVLLLGGLLARRYIAYASHAEVDWAGLAQEASHAYAVGGSAALGEWAAGQRRDGIDATLFEDGHPLYPIRLPPRIRARLPAWLALDENAIRRPWPGLYVVTQQIVGADGASQQLLAVSHSHLRRRARAGIFLATQLTLSLLLIAVVGWWVARSVTRPVEALRRATQRMAAGELSVRVGTRGRLVRDELTRLADDFDTMAARIEALVAHDRSVLQDLSHELRSPLARLHLILDLARHSETPAAAGAYFDEAEQEMVRLDAMLGEMLALSRMEGGLPGTGREPVDLADVLRACLKRARIGADARRVELRAVGIEAAVVSGSRALLERALDNVLANAVKFSTADGRVEAGLRVIRGGAELVVRDHGPGVPDAELRDLFRPFFRGSNAGLADGHGLGLAIVQRVVRAHGGSVAASNAAGGGLEVRLRLPLD